MQLKTNSCILLLLLSGCQNPAVEENGEVEIFEQEKFESIEDTILEKNNPRSLDLSKHQLFIDTTRNSDFYRNLTNWKPNEYATRSVESDISGLNKISKYRKNNFGNFPKNFVRLNKLKGEFYLYDRCDGIDPRYELSDSTFAFYGPLESSAETIRRIYRADGQGIKLELNSFEGKTSDKVSTLEILKTDNSSIYKMKYYNSNYTMEEFIIPAKEITRYDLVVNHCPVMKMQEFTAFYYQRKNRSDASKSVNRHSPESDTKKR